MITRPTYRSKIRVIPVGLHIAADYITSMFLLSAPWLLGWSADGTARLLAVSTGALIIVMSLLTRYAGGALKVIPFDVHLLLDLLLGFVFVVIGALSSGPERWVFLALGIIAIVFGACTRRKLIQRFRPLNTFNSRRS